jgi:hypothetical protein
MERYIADNGGEVFTNRSFYIPFSNGYELGLHSEILMKREFAFVTTEM